MAGDYLVLEVSDTGSGMSEAIQKRIFEPFFTTKEQGKGTGLGLATVLGVVEQNSGFIELLSTEGEGSTFALYFPRVFEATSSETPSSTGDESLRGGHETILVVEDERRVRHIAQEGLQRLGYHVLVAEDGAEALALSGSYDKRIDLLFTDVVMPGMSGQELAVAIGARRPETRVLYTSGYAEDIVVHHGRIAEGIAFLSKPYTIGSLAVRVRDVLEQAAS